jgi:hypothetical protein
MSEYCPSEGSQTNERQKKYDKQFPPTEQEADEGKEEIEHLLDGQRPKNVPVAGEIAASSLKDIHVEGEGRNQCSSEPSRLCWDNEVMEMCNVEEAE